MKKLRLIEKKVMLDVGIVNSSPKEITLTSKEFLKAALEGYTENLKGIDKIYRSANLLDKIKKADGEIILEDHDFNLIKESVDKCQTWGGIILHFPEFIDSIMNPEQAKVQLDDKPE